MLTAEEQQAIARFLDPDTGKVNLLGLSYEDLLSFFAVFGEKRFRAEQVMKWIHHLGAESLEDMTNISKKLKEKLADIVEIRAPEILFQKDSLDGTRKWLMQVTGGSSVETVLFQMAIAVRFAFHRRWVARWIVVFAQPVNRVFNVI